MPLDDGELRLTEDQALVVRAALIMVRDNTSDMARKDMAILRWAIDCMQMEGVEIVLRRSDVSDAA